MDYQNRVGSKKGGGGVASDSQANMQRRKQVDELLRQGADVPYTFAENETSGEEGNERARSDPYIYKNHSGRLVCKLCNTMHMSWSSVERHLSGKKHGLNVLRRSKLDARGDGAADKKRLAEEQSQYEQDVQKERENIRHSGEVPPFQAVAIRDPETQQEGVCVRVDYSGESSNDSEYPPFARIVLGLELASEEDKDKKYIVVANEPWENVAVEIPNREISLDASDGKQGNDTTIDEFNRTCTHWAPDLGYFFVQLLFKGEAAGHSEELVGNEEK